ncbi:uncharacterized protein AB675_5286 [Cyphellophora attinorum]|uniref:Uncharacterized protein n=1 Tax=Cyphellophora attinorum TaxID=1664694 RepID=A0A0N1P1C1_9EURO|nr:uncharacterized protein AB675_5286 [Phialophora attinorum]KPI41936.1 hypothetical protein AB675_5286 [Phialophora attinorum]
MPVTIHTDTVFAEMVRWPTTGEEVLSRRCDYIPGRSTPGAAGRGVGTIIDEAFRMARADSVTGWRVCGLKVMQDDLKSHQTSPFNSHPAKQKFGNYDYYHYRNVKIEKLSCYYDIDKHVFKVALSVPTSTDTLIEGTSRLRNDSVAALIVTIPKVKDPKVVETLVVFMQIDSAMRQMQEGFVRKAMTACPYIYSRDAKRGPRKLAT